MLLLGLRLGLLDLALLNWLGLTEGVCQLGIVDHQIVVLVGLGVIDHLDFGLRLGRVEVASCIGHSEAASHLRLLGAGIEPRVGESGVARGLPAWRVGGGRGCAEPEGLALLLELFGGLGEGPLHVVELGPESVEGLLELLLESLHDSGEVELDSLQLEFLLLRGQARIGGDFLTPGTLCHVFGPGCWHLAHVEPGEGHQEGPVLLGGRLRLVMEELSMVEGVEDEHRCLLLLDLRERQGILGVFATFAGCLSVIVELEQYGGQMSDGDVVGSDEGAQILFEELESCLSIESSHIGAAAVDHLEHLVEGNVLVLAAPPEVLAKAVDVLHGELEGVNDCEGGGQVEAGGPSFGIVQEQGLRLEERLLGELGQFDAVLLCLGGCLGCLGLLHELDGAAGCYRCRG